MWRSTHHEEILRIVKAYDCMLNAYIGRIEDLKKHNESLNRLIFIAPPKEDPVQYEADSVISGSDKPISISEEEHNRILERSREADLLMSGNYSEDLL